MVTRRCEVLLSLIKIGIVIYQNTQFWGTPPAGIARTLLIIILTGTVQIHRKWKQLHCETYSSAGSLKTQWKQVGFWSLVFIVFPVTAVTLDTNFAIFGVQNLSFGGVLPPFSYPGDHFVTLGHPGGAWEQQEGHVGVNSVFFWSLFPGFLCIEF